MRKFSLVNSQGKSYDITTEDTFFHSPEGLGFQRDDTYHRVGSRFLLANSAPSQGIITGKLNFITKDPYADYQKFLDFCNDDLQLVYEVSYKKSQYETSGGISVDYMSAGDGSYVGSYDFISGIFNARYRKVIYDDYENDGWAEVVNSTYNSPSCKIYEYTVSEDEFQYINIDEPVACSGLNSLPTNEKASLEKGLNGVCITSDPSKIRICLRNDALAGRTINEWMAQFKPSFLYTLASPVNIEYAGGIYVPVTLFDMALSSNTTYADGSSNNNAEITVLYDTTNGDRVRITDTTVKLEDCIVGSSLRELKINPIFDYHDVAAAVGRFPGTGNNLVPTENREITGETGVYVVEYSDAIKDAIITHVYAGEAYKYYIEFEANNIEKHSELNNVELWVSVNFASNGRAKYNDQSDVFNTADDGMANGPYNTETLTTSFYPIERSVPTTFHPIESINLVNVKSFNLLDITAMTQTVNGVTFTVNTPLLGGPKAITITGTATADAVFVLNSDYFFPYTSDEFSMQCGFVCEGSISEINRLKALNSISYGVLYNRDNPNDWNCRIDLSEIVSSPNDPLLLYADKNIDIAPVANHFRDIIVKVYSGTTFNSPIILIPYISCNGEESTNIIMDGDLPSEYRADVYNIPVADNMGKVYGADIDFVNGTLIKTWDCIDSYNGEELPEVWLSSLDPYIEEGTPTIGAQVLFPLENQVLYNLSDINPFVVGSYHNHVFVNYDNLVEGSPVSNPNQQFNSEFGTINLEYSGDYYITLERQEFDVTDTDLEDKYYITGSIGNDQYLKIDDPDPMLDPSLEGWYELGITYEPTEDTSIVEGRTYYIQTANYEDFLSVIGADSYYYEAPIYEGKEYNPKEEGWYEIVDGEYVLTEDEAVVPGTTYYAIYQPVAFELYEFINDEYVLTSDWIPRDGITYYMFIGYTYTPVIPDDEIPFESGWYIQIDTGFIPSEDIAVSPSKTYYEHIVSEFSPIYDGNIMLTVEISNAEEGGMVTAHSSVVSAFNKNSPKDYLDEPYEVIKHALLPAASSVDYTAYDYQKYMRDVRISKVSKAEINRYHTLEIDLELKCLSPWLAPFRKYQKKVETTGHRFVWGSDVHGDDNPWNIQWSEQSSSSIAVDSNGTNPSPCILAIYGPSDHPRWAHYNNGVLVSSGDCDISLSAGQILVIDSTEGHSSVCVYNSDGSLASDVYQRCDFAKDTFIFLGYGENIIQISDSGSSFTNSYVEGDIYYESV